MHTLMQNSTETIQWLRRNNRYFLDSFPLLSLATCEGLFKQRCINEVTEGRDVRKTFYLVSSHDPIPSGCGNVSPSL